MKQISLLAATHRFYVAIMAISFHGKVAAASPSEISHQNSSPNELCHFSDAETSESYQQLLDLRRQAASMTAMSTEEVSYLQNRQEELVGRTLTLNDAIRRLNRQTLEQLATKLREIPEYQKAKQQRQLTMKRFLKNDDLPSASEFLNPMIEAANWMVKDWVSNLTRQITNQETLVLLPDEPMLRCLNEAESSHMIASQVHSFFSHGSSNIMDFASLQAGARVVYAESLTSDTYISHTHHQFLGYWRNLFLHLFGMSSAISAPERVLSNSALHAGSCWPMKGKSGKITIKFPFPIHVTNITLEHLSPDLEKLVLSTKKRHGSSAPRFLQWIGYPPCTDFQNDSYHCHLLGFDLTRPIILNESFEYKISSFPFAQTFPAIYEQDNNGERKYSLYDEGMVLNNRQLRQDEELLQCSVTSCMATTDDPSLSAPDFTKLDRKKSPLSVQAVTLIVEDNWGNEDYTCLYRVRVYGNTEKITDDA